MKGTRCMDKIAVLIPCYNEAKTISKVVSDFRAAFPSDDAVIYVYDNNSSDQTAQLAASEGAVVRRERKQGKGNVIRRMFREIDAECYIMVDGDDTYPAEFAPEMARLVLEDKSDMVVGDRLSSTYFTENKRAFHNFGNRIVRLLVRRLFKSDVKDIMTGYRAFSYNFVKTYSVLSKGFEIETEMTIHACDNNMQIDNVVVEYRDRPEGSVSKLNTISDGVKVLKTIVSLYKNYRPMQFFGILASIFMLLGIGFFIPILVDFINTGRVDKFPTLFVCCTTMIVAFLFFFTGLLLQTMRQRNKREFEMTLIRAEDGFKIKKNMFYKGEKTNEQIFGNTDSEES